MEKKKMRFEAYLEAKKHAKEEIRDKIMHAGGYIDDVSEKVEATENAAKEVATTS